MSDLHVTPSIMLQKGPSQREGVRREVLAKKWSLLYRGGSVVKVGGGRAGRIASVQRENSSLDTGIS